MTRKSIAAHYVPFGTPVYNVDVFFNVTRDPAYDSIYNYEYVGDQAYVRQVNEGFISTTYLVQVARPSLDLLLWLDRTTRRYWFVAYALLYAVMALALAPAASPRARRLFGTRRTDALLLALGALTLFAFHWPSFYWEWPSNPDEAQMLAQAIKSAHAPIPWLAYDPTTSGPLNTAVLALPALFGVTPGYVSARIEATLLVLGSLTFFFAAMGSLFDERIARLATLPVFAFFALCESSDFNGYTSELTPIFLITFVLLCVAKAPRVPMSRLVALALLTGTATGAVFLQNCSSARWRWSKRSCSRGSSSRERTCRARRSAPLSSP